MALEIGGGEGALSDRLAPRVAHLHVIELDRRLAGDLGATSARHPNLSVVWGDAMRVDLRALRPSPTAVVSNLPYSIATPVLLRTVAELPEVDAWTVMVQREIADRLRAAPGLADLRGARACSSSSPATSSCCAGWIAPCSRPRPRVDSALLRLTRRGPAAPPGLAGLVRGAFAHRRKPMAGSLELAGGPSREAVRAALGDLGLDEGARAEALAPADFVRVAERLGVR